MGYRPEGSPLNPRNPPGPLRLRASAPTRTGLQTAPITAQPVRRNRTRCEPALNLLSFWRRDFGSGRHGDIERRDGQYLAESAIKFNASFILGGQLSGEPLRLFRIYAEGNFIEAGLDTPYLQTGETKYGKPIIDRVITRSTTLADAAKCVLLSFDSTMRSNLSVGMPIDLICYQRDSLKMQMRRRFDEGDAYFTALSSQWSKGVRHVFSELPELPW